MQKNLARFPFLSPSQQKVEELDADLGEIATRNTDPTLARAVERVKTALKSREIGDYAWISENEAEKNDERFIRQELISYPLARILVSLSGEQVAIERYVEAEAQNAYRAMKEQILNDSIPMTMEYMLGEFGLTDAVTEHDTEEKYRVQVSAFLEHSKDYADDEYAETESWQLSNATLTNGEVIVDEEMVLKMMKSAAKKDIKEPLPFNVPDVLESSLENEMESIDELIQNHDPVLPSEVDRIDERAFPPVIKDLIEKSESGLGQHERMVLLPFFAQVGVNQDKMVEILGVNTTIGKMLRNQMERIQSSSGSVAFTTPSYEVLAKRGVCDEEVAEESDYKTPAKKYVAKLRSDTESQQNTSNQSTPKAAD